MVNYDDVVGQLTAAGLVLKEPGRLEVDTRRFVRCRVAGEGSKDRGWYRLHSVPMSSQPGQYLIVGAFGVWRGPEHESHKVAIAKDAAARMSAEEIALTRRLHEQMARDAASERARELDRLAERAAGWWARMLPSGRSEYLVRKGLPPGDLFGARVSERGNLVVPAMDVKGRIRCLQVIYSDPAVKRRKGRDKDFTPAGAAKREHFFPIGGAPYPGAVVLVCEGFATGATLHQATGLPVVVAFDAGNLSPVAQAIAKAHRGVRLLFCADDDYDWQLIEDKPKPNTGIIEAQKAALAVRGGVCIPTFPGERPTRTHKGATDFNDLATMPDGGLHMVSAQVMASLSALGWSSRVAGARTRAQESSGGGGASPQRPMLKPLYTLDEAVEKWVLVYGANGCYFDAEEHCLVPKADVLALLPDHASREWKQHPGRQIARLSEVGFDPTEKDSAVRCNLWGGWPTVPKAGDCSLLLELLEYLCSGEENAAECLQFVLRWLAFPIQHPGAKMRSTLIFHGDQGAGKNIFFEAVKRIYGDYGRIIDQSAVEDKFNDWASRKLFLVADEVVARNELYYLKNKLKGIITGEWIRINPKQVAAHDERNHVNIVFLSNELQPQVIEFGDRRHFVVWTPPKLSKAFYRSLGDALANGAVEALHHHLLHLDLGDFNEHTEPPMTAAKAAVQQLSASSTERFLSDWTALETALPCAPCSSGQLYLAYSRWCGARGEKPRAHMHLSSQISRMRGWILTHKDVFHTATYSGSPRRVRMVIPSAESMEATAKAGEDYRRPADQTETQWMTDCFFRMAAALGDAS